jgi:hypothetical protein
MNFLPGNEATKQRRNYRTGSGDRMLQCGRAACSGRGSERVVGAGEGDGVAEVIADVSEVIDEVPEAIDGVPKPIDAVSMAVDGAAEMTVGVPEVVDGHPASALTESEPRPAVNPDSAIP